MEIFHLLYVSTAVAPMKKEEFEELLETSSANNKGLNITGMLLYRSGFFVQLLEGEESAVKALYEKIKKDPRHRESEILIEFPEDSRLFPQWYMGVISEPLHTKELVSMVESLRESKAEAKEAVAKQAVSLLKSFSKRYSKA